MYYLKTLRLCLALLCIPYIALSQTTIFSETFDEANGATSGVSAEGVAWNSVCPGCIPTDDLFSVLNGVFIGDDTNDPATWTSDPIDISTCSSISISLDYSGDTYIGSGSNVLDLPSDCIGPPCSGDPADANLPECICWDFADFNVTIDGVTTNLDLIGNTYIPTNAVVELDPTCVNNDNAIIYFTMRTTGADEEMMVDNIVMLCWEEPVAEALATEVCEGESINLSETTSDGVSWSWTGPAGSSPNDAWNINNGTIAESGIYTVAVTDINSCASSDAIDITVYQQPEANWVDSDLMEDVCNGGCIEIELDLVGTPPFQITFEGAVIGIGNEETLTFEAGETTLIACLDYNGNLFDPVDWDDSDNSVHVWPGVTVFTNMGTLTIFDIEDANGCINLDNSPVFTFTIIEEEIPMFDDLGPYCDTDNINVSFPNISNNGISGTWSPSNAFNPSTLGAGMYDYTFTPNTDECAEEITVMIVVDACSCSLTSAVASNIICQSDGLVTFEVTIDGVGVGTIWQGSDGMGNIGNGNYGVPVEMGPFFSSGIPSYPFTFNDLNDPSCTIDLDVPVPDECYCDIEFSGFTFSQLDCHDNDTPGDPTDDYIIFQIDPTGVGLGTSYTISTIPTIPPGGTYGIPQVFQTLPGTAGAGGMIITLADDTYSLCVLEFWLPDPGTCSDGCDIMATATPPDCDDASTPSLPSDDTFSFDITVTGTGTSWTANDALGTNGTYGVPQNFSGYLISSGSVSITITDDDDPSCTVTISIDPPPSCSNECDVEATITSVQCNDGGTPSDPTDDFLTFMLNPTGANLGSAYTLSGISTTPPGAMYGMGQQFATNPGTAGNGDINFSVVDGDDITCTIDLTLMDIGTCSNLCNIMATATLPDCDDESTPSLPLDDTFSFDITVTGTGTSWTANDALGTTGTYGVPQNFSGYVISAGSVSITITNDDDPSCTVTISIDPPPSCSNECDVEATITSIQCNDGGTPSDPTDDFLTFMLNPTGASLGSAYTLSGISTTPPGAMYGMAQQFATDPGTAGNGDINFSVVDGDDITCTIDLTLMEIGSCSSFCDIMATATLPDCDDANTPTLPLDDTFSFDVTVIGASTGTSWTANDPLATTGTYGIAQNFSGYLISVGSVTITFTDDNDPLCTTTITIDPPASCSNECDVEAMITSVQCNNGGTPSDPSDDFLTFVLDPIGTNLGSAYVLSGVTTTPPGAMYGMAQQFATDPGTAGNGDISFSVVDGDEPTCSVDLTLMDIGTCSNLCDIMATASLPDCDDEGTPSLPSDDTFSFNVTVTGANTGTSWIANDPLGTTGTYGIPQNFSGYLISAGSVSITFTDDNDPFCTTTINVDPPASCSNECDIEIIVNNISCNNFGTPSDDTDDQFYFDILVTGSNTGATWTTNDMNMSTGIYGQMITLGPYDISNGDFTLTVEDITDNLCSETVIITAPATCSTTCSISSAIIATPCFDQNTPSLPDDDTYTVELFVSGLNLGGGWTADDPLGSTGLYGANVVIGPYLISDGPFTFTITDNDASPACETVVNVIPPMTCSELCDISAVISVPDCDENNTPSDPTDDTYTFNVTVNGMNTGASWIATDPAMTTGSYGVPQSFGPFPIAGGDINFSISDILDGFCQTPIMVTAPPTCSDVCDITALVGVVFCEEGTTPSDPDDDTFSFEVTVTGANTGAMWTSDDPNGMTGNYGATVIFGPYDISNGDVTITIFDGVDGLCTSVITVAAPPTCSNLCAIEYTATLPMCNNNNSPSDSGDDTFTFELTVTGLNTGASWNATDPLMTGGNYGNPASFGPYPISGGDLMFNITDINDPDCQTTVNVSAPVTCSNLCVIDYTITNIVCNNNTTPSDDTDDTFTFDIVVTGENTGTGWTANDPTLSSGSYGVVTPMGPYPIAAGPLSFTITDDASNTCTVDVMVTEPFTCSTTCSISNTIIETLCDDSGTPSNPSDDLFTVEIIVSGLNLGGGWTADDPLSTTGLYGVTIILGPYPISGGPFTVIIEDDMDDACITELLITPPVTCSNVCNIEVMVSNITCTNSNTPSDPNDDMFTFDVFVDGMNLGSSWSANDANNSSGSYGVISSFGPFDVANGAVGFTITDGVDPTCTFFVSVDPPVTCSDQCDIITLVENIICNDNNSPSDPSDDTFTFDVLVNGANVATGWSATDPNATSGTYGISQNFGNYLISGGAISFDIIDGIDLTCLETISVTPPMTCSDVCDIIVTVGDIFCTDNNTPSIADDDVFSFEVTVIGSNISGNWTASDPNNTNGAYNSTIIFGPYPISGGDISFTITDGVEMLCTEIVNVEAPPTCSPDCTIDFMVTNILCDPAGSPSDDTDDLYTFDVVVTGSNTAGSWTANDPNGTMGAYDATISFGPFLISNGNQNFTITDAGNTTCTANVTVLAPSSCSTTCSITNLVDNISCNDNGTPSLPDDDLFFFDLIITGSNIGTSWSADDPLSTSGLYGVTVPMGPYLISGGILNFTVTDDLANPACTTVISVAPPITCSDVCNIEAEVSGVICNDNNTPSNPNDDTYFFDVLVTGMNNGTTWSSNDPNGVSGEYGVLTNFGPFDISAGDVNFTITDGNEISCSVAINVTAPSTCSPDCALEIVQSNLLCDDNGTPSNAADDTYSFDVIVTGSNNANTWIANDPNSTGGLYDVLTNFGPYPISGGDINFDITDLDDGACIQTLNIIAPMTCSDVCDISAVVSSVQCQDNGTPSNPADDVFTFDVLVSGMNTGTVWTATDPNSTSGSYDAVVTFGPYLINGGSIIFTITDGMTNTCVEVISVNPPPITCSEVCEISYTVNNVLCNDNGTPSNDADDTYTFDIFVSGLNTGGMWTANDPNLSSGNYDQSYTLGPYPISNGNQNFVITDATDPLCTTTVLVQAPTACSTSCSISNSVTLITCDDNNTPSNPDDDLFYFELIITGANTGTSWTADDPNLSGGLYGNQVQMGPYNISDGILNFIVTDGSNDDCTTIVSVIPPLTCSSLCSLEATVIGVFCDDNNTPSNPADDLFSFSLFVDGVNTGTSWTADDPNATSGAYGNTTLFGPYMIIDGDIVFDIGDGFDFNCFINVQVEAPAPCSEACNIEAGLFEYSCDDNGTPSIPGDDTFIVEVFVDGVNGSTSWTATDPNTTTGNFGEFTSFGPYPISGGDISFDIVDDNFDMCSEMLTFEAPETCSDLCVLEVNITNTICDDNNTPSDNSDDLFSFDVTVVGTNSGTSWQATDPNATNGAYDVTVSFGPFAISGGNVNFVISDLTDPSCIFSVEVTPPVACSNACEIDYVLSNVLCNINNTPSDDSDDTYTFDIVVTGSNTAASWTANDPNNTTGTYGSVINFGPYNIVDGSQNFLINDDGTNGCSVTAIVIAPDACSSSCSLTNIVSNIVCDANETPTDPSDDIFYFDLEITGSNFGSGWTANDPNFSGGGYNTVVSLGPYIISDGILNFVVEDSSGPDCTTIVSVEPPVACSDDCEITYMVTNYDCNDNDTPLDALDDYFSFNILVEGENVGTSWTADDTNLSSGAYNSVVSLGPYLVSDGDFSFTITDGVDPACAVMVSIVAPPACSNACNLDYEVSELNCNDNGTPEDAADDFFSFMILVNETNVNGTGWTADDTNLSTGVYAVAQMMGPYFMSDGDLSFTIVDSGDPSCSVNVFVETPDPCDQAPCSIDYTIANIVCDDNGTVNDTTDDTFFFDISVDGTNTSANGWTANDITMATGSYGMVTTLGPYLVTDGDLNFIITDTDDLGCITSINVVAPMDCANLCAIQYEIIDVQCSNLGTADPSDDVFSFELLVTGTGVSGSWISDNLGVNGGVYNSNINYDGFSIADGDLIFTITDSDNSDCFIEVVVQVPETCSESCSVELILGEVTCDNNGTEDPLDDTYSFTVTPSGVNSSANWQVSGDATGTGLFGTEMQFGPYLIADGDVSLLFADENIPDCDGLIIISAPASCSSDCSFVIDAGENQFLNCDNPEVILEGTSQNGGNSSWIDSGGAIISNTINVTIEESGQYYFQVDFGGGCIVTDSVQINADFEIPYISLVQMFADPCSPEGFVLDASASDVSEDISFVWTRLDGSVIATSDLIIDAVAGTYYLEATDASNGCSNLDSIEVTNTIFSSPETRASYSLVTGTTFQLDVFSDGDIAQILWSNADVLSCSNCVNPIATLNSSTTFFIEITYVNGCTEELTLYVPITGKEEIFISNIFSPNNDGKNDVFYVQSVVDRTISEFAIYDRWGNRVKYSQNVLTNNPDFGWKGDWNGEDLNPGVYMYYIVIENAQGVENVFSGDISILR